MQPEFREREEGGDSTAREIVVVSEHRQIRRKKKREKKRKKLAASLKAQLQEAIFGISGVRPQTLGNNLKKCDAQTLLNIQAQLEGETPEQRLDNLYKATMDWAETYKTVGVEEKDRDQALKNIKAVWDSGLLSTKGKILLYKQYPDLQKELTLTRAEQKVLSWVNDKVYHNSENVEEKMAERVYKEAKSIAEKYEGFEKLSMKDQEDNIDRNDVRDIQAALDSGFLTSEQRADLLSSLPPALKDKLKLSVMEEVLDIASRLASMIIGMFGIPQFQQQATAPAQSQQQATAEARPQVQHPSRTNAWQRRCQTKLKALGAFKRELNRAKVRTDVRTAALAAHSAEGPEDPRVSTALTR